MAGLGSGPSGSTPEHIRSGKYLVEAGVDDKGVQSGLGRIQGRFKEFSKKIKDFVPEGNIFGKALAKGAQGGLLGAGATAAYAALGPTIQKVRDQIEDSLLNTKLINAEMERMADHWKSVAESSHKFTQDRLEEAKNIQSDARRVEFLQQQLKSAKDITSVLEQQQKGAKEQAGFSTGREWIDYLGFGDMVRKAGAEEVKNIGQALRESKKDADKFREAIKAAKLEIATGWMKTMKGFEDELTRLNQAQIDLADDKDFKRVTEGWSDQAKEMEKYARQVEKIAERVRKAAFEAKNASESKHFKDMAAALEDTARVTRQSIPNQTMPPWLGMVLGAAGAVGGFDKKKFELKDAAHGAFATPFSGQQFGDMGRRKSDATLTSIKTNTGNAAKVLNDIKESMRFV